MRYGFVIDQRKCIGCHACTVACKEENQVPLGVNRTWVKYIEKGTFPDTRRYFSVLRCNHCESAPCVVICPTRALYHRRDGIVDLDGDRCIGCKSCMQACPYDALYIDPETRTAGKCHYCAHRVEVGLEPACVIVCPVQAIVPGDLDDPGSTISRLVASQQTQVRKPEQGTQPKLFYLGAEDAALTPHMQVRADGYLFAQLSSVPVPGERNLVGSSSAHETREEGPDLLRLARTVYDTAHARAPWGWKVSTYLWTKSIAAGALFIAAFGTGLGLVPDGVLAGVAAPLIALIFLAITTALLIADLKRPERFLYLLFKPNWRSWLVLGGWILIAFGAVAGLWLAAGWMLHSAGYRWLAWPAVLLSLATAGYSAFLFGQAEGRDYWQSPMLLPHLLAASALAGSAALLLASTTSGAGAGTMASLRVLVLVSALATLGLVVAETVSFHPTRDTARAAHLLSRGRLAGAFWGGAVLAGLVAPVLLLTMPLQGAWVLGAALALAGLWLYEDLWVRAGQSIPLS